MVKKKVYKAKTDAGLLDQITFITFVAGFRFSVVDKKWPNIRKAFSNFNVKKLASLSNKDVDKLMNAKDMIKNRGKIEAAIWNAQFMLRIKDEHGSVLKWLEKIKKVHEKDPLLNPSLQETFQQFKRIGATTSGWLGDLYSAKKDYVEYDVPGTT